MINLLPPQEKAELRQEENMRLVFLFEFLFLIFLISLFLGLLSIKISIAGEAEIQRVLYSEREKEFENSPLPILERQIIESNEKLSRLNSFYERQFNFTEISELISKNLPPEMYLSGLTIASLPEGRGGKACSLFGFSPNRESLLQFKENLEKEKKFNEINFPSSNWVTSENINFLATFKTK